MYRAPCPPGDEEAYSQSSTAQRPKHGGQNALKETAHHHVPHPGGARRNIRFRCQGWHIALNFR